MYFSLSHALGALYLQGRIVGSFQVNEHALKGYFVLTWVHFFLVDIN
jgi:hypothetical protein